MAESFCHDLDIQRVWTQVVLEHSFGGQMKVVSFIEPPQADLIEEILKHCGLWQASSPRAPPDVEGLVLELDAAYSANSIGSPDQADESQELTYIDIDPFLESF
jgi:hypothetical protein